MPRCSSSGAAGSALRAARRAAAPRPRPRRGRAPIAAIVRSRAAELPLQRRKGSKGSAREQLRLGVRESVQKVGPPTLIAPRMPLSSPLMSHHSHITGNPSPRPWPVCLVLSPSQFLASLRFCWRSSFYRFADQGSISEPVASALATGSARTSEPGNRVESITRLRCSLHVLFLRALAPRPCQHLVRLPASLPGACAS